jgi:uncharacterized membrane protein
LESRFATRALRGTAVYRHLLNPEILQNTINKYVFDQELRKLFGESAKVIIDSTISSAPVPEVEIFVGLLVVYYLLDQKNTDKVEAVDCRV